MLTSLIITWAVATLYLITIFCLYFEFHTMRERVSVSMGHSIVTYPKVLVQIPFELHIAIDMFYSHGHYNAYRDLQSIRNKMKSLIVRLKAQPIENDVLKELDLEAKKLWLHCTRLTETVKPDWSSLLSLHKFSVR